MILNNPVACDLSHSFLLFPHCPCRDALESVTSLYNQVEEKLHTLVMRSNESLQQLELLFRLRETEANISTVIQVLSPGSQQFKSTICEETFTNEVFL